MSSQRHGLQRFFMKHWLHKSGWRLLPGLIAAGLTLMTARTGVLQPLEQSVYRTLFHVRGEQPWDDRVAVIEIDDASLAEIGQFPWPRHYYTDLLDRLTPASVIAFDILFAESSEDDFALAQAMRRHGDVVLATAWDEDRGVIGPNARVVEGAIATGHIHHRADTDGITRSYQPKINGTLALSVLAVQRYGQKQPYAVSVPDINQSLWLNWPGETHDAPRYSFVDVLTGQVSSHSFADKMVFIGFTGVGLDSMATPYNHNPYAAGVYQHVVAANNLLTRNYLRPIILPIWIAFIVCSGLTSYSLYAQRVRVQMLTTLTMMIAWGGIVVLAFSYSYLLPTIVPIVSLTLTIVLARVTEYVYSKLRQLGRTYGLGPVNSLSFQSALKSPITVIRDR